MLIWEAYELRPRAKGMLHGQEKHQRSWPQEFNHLITPYTKMQKQLIIISLLTICFHTDVEATIQHAQSIKVWPQYALPRVAIMSSRHLAPTAQARTQLKGIVASKNKSSRPPYGSLHPGWLHSPSPGDTLRAYPHNMRTHPSRFQWLFHTNSLSWLLLQIFLKPLKSLLFFK